MLTYDRDGTQQGSCPDKYDVQLTNEDGDSCGFVLYSDADTPPWAWKIEPTQLPTNNSQQTDNGDLYDIRDANDYWRITYTDWCRGAGQATRDEADALPSKFWDAQRVNTETPGSFTLGPGLVSYVTSPGDIEGKSIAALKNSDGDPVVFSSFTPAGSDPRATIRYSDDNVTWRAVTFDGTDPTGVVLCFTTDGQYVYAGIGSDGIWRGTASMSVAWTKWSTKAGIVALCYAGGYMFAADATTLYYFDATPTAQEIKNAGVTLGLGPSVTTAGLVANGNTVHWVVTNGQRSDVYEAWLDVSSGSVVPQFQHVCTFPTGFVARCAYSYLGVTYVGGAYEDVADKGQGAIYAVMDGGLSILTTIGVAAEDWRVMSITAWGKSLYFLCNGSIWRWDLTKGGYAHYMGPFSSEAAAWDPWDVEEEMTSEPTTGWTRSGTAGTFDGTGTIPSGTSYTYSDASSVTSGALEIGIPSGTASGSTYDQGEFGLRNGSYEIAAKLHSSTHIRSNVVEIVTADLLRTVVFATGSAHTITLRIIGGLGYVWADGVLIHSGLALPASTAKGCFFEGPIKIDYLHYARAYADAELSSVSVISACADEVWCPVADTAIYKGGGYTSSGWLKCSESTARMSTVPKYFAYLDVVLEQPLQGSEAVTAQVMIDGTTYDAGTFTEDGTLLTAPIDQTGIAAAPVISLTSATTAPVVKHVVLRFTPMSSSRGIYTFTANLNERAQSRDGAIWDIDPQTAIDFLRDSIGKVVDVDFYGLWLRGRIEEVTMRGAAMSRRGNAARQGIAQFTVREMR